MRSGEMMGGDPWWNQVEEPGRWCPAPPPGELGDPGIPLRPPTATSTIHPLTFRSHETLVDKVTRQPRAFWLPRSGVFGNDDWITELDAMLSDMPHASQCEAFISCQRRRAVVAADADRAGAGGAA